MRRYGPPAALLAGLALAAAVAVAGLGHGQRPPPAQVAAAVTTRPAEQRAPRRPTGPHDQPVPILMYHVIAAPPPGAPNPELYVQPSDFSGQVAWLAAHGYRAVTLDALYRYWQGETVLPQHPIVLSFDDGYHSQFANAMPVLQARGWPGVLNLEVANLKPVWGLRPGLVRKLIAAGWEVDAHTMTHPDLTTLDSASLQREVAGSRDAIRKQFGVPVEFFCYPSGRYDDTVLAAVRAAGYLGATTTEEALARPDDPYTLARVRVDGSDGVSGLAGKLERLAPPALP